MARMESAKAQALKHINLIDVRTYQFVNNRDVDLSYFARTAILSHRWRRDGETTKKHFAHFIESSGQHLSGIVNASFMEMDDNETCATLCQITQPTQRPDQKLDRAQRAQMLGLAKVLKFCRLAWEDGFNYVWVDTCCIDKENKEATSKAISSMWDYYSLCRRCYVYLSDVSVNDGSGGIAEFQQSEWFTRGWTLQELLASKTTYFYDQLWRRIDLGAEGRILSVVAQSCHIDRSFIEDPGKACVAQKMSWLSGRETWFDEDMAYCMLGIFGVQMPVDYGEGGKKAFLRLQIEIMKDSRYARDESIFAWTGIPEGARLSERATACGLLAPWPSHFVGCANLELIPPGECVSQLQPQISETRAGIEIQIPAKHLHMNHGADSNVADLAKSIEMGLLLNVRHAHGQNNGWGGQSSQDGKRRKSFFGLGPAKDSNKARANGSRRVALSLIRNTEKEWRRRPSQQHEFNDVLKQSKHTMPFFVPHTAAPDNAAQLQQAGPARFGDGMRAAINARKEQIR